MSPARRTPARAAKGAGTPDGIRRVVVDGSNLATEGRKTPSLSQLDEAVRAYAAEDAGAEIIVVVDATFGHRIDANERAAYEEAELHGEIVSPPAGAIGRGDAFVLRIAERTDGRVLSNDSFQEFQEEHPWLHDEGRLWGGKSVKGVGWIFTPRRPVRNLKIESGKKKKKHDGADPATPTATTKAVELTAAVRKAARKAAVKPAKPGAKPAKKPAKKVAEKAVKKAAQKAPAKKATKKPAKKVAAKKAVAKTDVPAKAVKAAKAIKPVKKSVPTGDRPHRGRRPAAADPAVFDAIEQAAVEALVPAVAGRSPTRGKRGKGSSISAPMPAVNEPAAFLRFVAANPLGSEVDGEVVSFTSHGAMVAVNLEDGTALRCYIPLSGMASPAPTKAREILRRGEIRTFVLVALDPLRRVPDLAIPGVTG